MYREEKYLFVEDVTPTYTVIHEFNQKRVDYYGNLDSEGNFLPWPNSRPTVYSEGGSPGIIRQQHHYLFEAERIDEKVYEFRSGRLIPGRVNGVMVHGADWL
jgi:hypothetical protein